MKPILFIDFDGTLCHDRFWRSLQSKWNHKVQRRLFGDDKERVNQWMRGEHTSEEVNQFLAKELSLPYDALWTTFVRDCEQMQVRQEVLDLIQSLRKRYHVVLATDNMDCFTRFTVPALGLTQYFDEIWNSYDEKSFKNDNGGEVFKQFVTNKKSSIENSILADDSPRTCQTFKNLGGISYLVTKEQPLSSWLETLTPIFLSDL